MAICITTKLLEHWPIIPLVLKAQTLATECIKARASATAVAWSLISRRSPFIWWIIKCEAVHSGGWDAENKNCSYILAGGASVVPNMAVAGRSCRCPSRKSAESLLSGRKGRVGRWIAEAPWIYVPRWVPCMPSTLWEIGIDVFGARRLSTLPVAGVAVSMAMLRFVVEPCFEECGLQLILLCKCKIFASNRPWRDENVVETTTLGKLYMYTAADL